MERAVFLFLPYHWNDSSFCEEQRVERGCFDLFWAAKQHGMGSSRFPKSLLRCRHSRLLFFTCLFALHSDTLDLFSLFLSFSLHSVQSPSNCTLIFFLLFGYLVWNDHSTIVVICFAQDFWFLCPESLKQKLIGRMASLCSTVISQTVCTAEGKWSHIDQNL